MGVQSSDGRAKQEAEPLPSASVTSAAAAAFARMKPVAACVAQRVAITMTSAFRDCCLSRGCHMIMAELHLGAGRDGAEYAAALDRGLPRPANKAAL